MITSKHSFPVAVAVLLFLVAAGANAMPPRIAWDPYPLEGSVTPREEATYSVTITNTGYFRIPRTNQLQIGVRGDIAPYVTVEQPVFPRVFRRGDQVTFEVTFLLPQGSTGVFEGELVLQRKWRRWSLDVWRADPLPVRMQVDDSNHLPVADAGPDQTIAYPYVGETVTLDGSGSSDADGDPLTFQWSFTARPEGSTATLSNPTVVNPTFTIDVPGTYIAQLIVHDGADSSAADAVTISTQYSAPFADAGPDQTVLVGETVTLDGSSSADVDGDPLSYAWSLPGVPAGSTATLSDPTEVMPTFVADLPGSYVAQLIVNDGTLDSAPDTVNIDTQNSAPMADAGADQTALVGDTVTLDGSGSSDVDGDPLSFSWSLSTPSGSAAALNDTTIVAPNFDVDLPGSYLGQLIVNDGTENSAPDTVTITTENSPPVADAGPDQSLFVGDTVTLDGSGSDDVDGDPLTFSWSLVGTPANSQAQLSDPQSEQPTFVLDLPGTYVSQLIVNDGTVDSAPDEVVVSTQNSRPVADAGQDLDATVGDTVTLDGSGSSDADGDTLTFSWSLTTRPAGSTAVLVGADTATPTLTPDQGGEWIAQLIVNDGQLDSAPDTALVTVSAAPENQPPEITSSPVTTATVGALYNYDVEATDADGDTLTYSLTTSPPGMSIDPNTGLIEWTPNVAGDEPVSVQVADTHQAMDTQDFTITVSDALVTVPDLVGQTRTEAEAAITAAGLTVGTVTEENHPTVPAGQVISQDPSAGSSVAQATAVSLVVSLGPDSGLPPDPAEVAPPIDPTVATTTYASTEFLYTGENPIQTGVEPGTIEPKRAAVIRGKVLDKDNQPLSGATISILDHPELGQTLSRADGMFDMAANGGGYLTINYAREGYLPVQRKVNAPWQDYVWAPDVVMIPLDDQVTAIDLTSPEPIQVARGSVVTDSDGTRQAVLMIPQGTTAEITLPDGTPQSINTLTLRLTEYTVGDNGPEAMPAELPPTSGYTYAVELSADEALANGIKVDGKDVVFNQAVPFYVDNFLNFPTGGIVPVGYYDSNGGAWIAYKNGRVIKIVGITGGVADLDVDGDDLPDTGADLLDLGITDMEREQLGMLYAVEKSLWRVQLTHLSTWDCNQPFRPPDDADWPKQDESRRDEKEDNSCQEKRSIIECQNQALGEIVDVTGTPFSLHYQSARVYGRQAAFTLDIPLSGDSIPASLKRINLIVSIAGRRFSKSFPAATNQNYEFIWDGLDAYGRPLQGETTSSVKVGYVYDASYAEPVLSPDDQSFALPSDSSLIYDTARQEFTFWQLNQTSVGTTNGRKIAGLGGWSLTEHHSYNPTMGTLFLGDGSKRTADDINTVITTVAGNGESGSEGDEGPATEGQVNQPWGIAAGPEGSIYIADTGNHKVRRVTPDGIITTVAGNGEAGSEGDGGQAIDAQLNYPTGIAVGSDGSIYIADRSNDKVRWVNPDGIITTIAQGFSYPTDVAVGPDGSIYIANTFAHNIYKVTLTPDEIQTTIIAGSPYGVRGFEGDGGPATAALFSYPETVTVGPDGSIYIGDGTNYKVRRVTPDGIIRTVAGNGEPGDAGDGGQATEAQLYGLNGISLGPDGSIYLTCYTAVRRVTPDGIIRTVAGKSSTNDLGDGGPATAASINSSRGVAVGPDGNIYLAHSTHHRLRRVSSAFPGTTYVDDITIASNDGTELYIFDYAGRHLRTLNTLTGTVLYEVGYNANGQLTDIKDGYNNSTTIERDANGGATAIIAPFRQRTELSLDDNGYLSEIVNPANESNQFIYSDDGLLEEMTDPNGHTSVYSYDDGGRLIRDDDPSEGYQTLTRSELENGYEVTRTTEMGRITKYRVEDLPAGGKRLLNTFPDGTQAETIINTDSSRTVSLPDGTIITSEYGPDPRWGMSAPVASAVNVNAGGTQQSTTETRTVTLANANDPLSLTSMTRTFTVNGLPYTTVWDTATSTMTTTTPEVRTVVSTLDGQGRVTNVQAAGLAPTAIAYDGRGRLETVSQGTTTPRVTSIAYDIDGFVDTVTDPELQTVSFDYDNAGRVTVQTLPDTRNIGFSYDANGNLGSVIPPGRPPHSFDYTAVNLLDTYLPPDVGLPIQQTTYGYTLDRELEVVTRPDGLQIVFAYEPTTQKLLSVTAPRGTSSYTYDVPTGAVDTITTPDGNLLDYAWNTQLLTDVTSSGAVTGTVSFGYDDFLRVNDISINGADNVAFGYDDDGLLASAGAMSVARDPNHGLITDTTLSNTSTTRTYNEYGELTGLTTDVSGATLYDVQYTQRDNLGRITQKVETVEGVTKTFDYAYDPAGRLEYVWEDGVQMSQYMFDSNGNRLSHVTGGGTVTGTYDDQDRMESYGSATYAYTANGELMRKAVGADVTTYDYDVFGNLRTVDLPDGRLIEYGIDGQNRRISKSVDGVVTQRFLYRDQLNPVAMVDATGNVLQRFVYGTRINVPDYMVAGGTTYRIVSDHLGSVRLVVDAATGVVAQGLDYDEFGNVTLDTNPGFQPFGFAGGLYDHDTGLVRFGVRDYDSETGRWISNDPIFFAGNQTNLYLYAYNDAINFVDLDGTIPGLAQKLVPNDVIENARHAVDKVTGKAFAPKELDSLTQIVLDEISMLDALDFAKIDPNKDGPLELTNKQRKIIDDLFEDVLKDDDLKKQRDLIKKAFDEWQKALKEGACKISQ